MITSRDIANKKFERAGFGGYKNEEVDNFLNEVAATIEELEEKNGVLAKKLEVLAEKLEEYRSDEESLRAALLGAQKLGDSVIRESKTKAEIILRDANIKAERLINTAHEQVEKEKMVYIKMQKDVAAFKNKLLAIYRQHLEIISNLPGETSGSSKGTEEKPKVESEPVHEPEIEQPMRVSEPEPRSERKEEQPRPHAQEAIEEDFSLSNEEEEAIPAQDGEFDEPVAPPVKKRKFIPVPQHREEPAEPRKKAAYEEEYYEDFDEEEDIPASPKRSRFGTLKFGAGYDLKRE